MKAMGEKAPETVVTRLTPEYRVEWLWSGDGEPFVRVQVEDVPLTIKQALDLQEGILQAAQFALDADRRWRTSQKP